jgi:hypothetical protein
MPEVGFEPIISAPRHSRPVPENTVATGTSFLIQYLSNKGLANNTHTSQEMFLTAAIDPDHCMISGAYERYAVTSWYSSGG